MKSTLLSFAWKGFIRRRNLFVASIIGFALSVIVFVLVLSILEQSRKSVADVLTNTGTHFIAYKPACCAPPLFDAESKEGFLANGAPSQPFSRDLLSEISGLPSVKDASPFLLFLVFEEDVGMMIGGFDPENRIAVANTSCSSGDLVSGRFLTPEDSSAVILEHSFALLRNLTTGSSLTIKKKFFEVAGIVNPGIRPAKADVYMTLQAAERVISRSAAAPVKNLMNIILVESAGAHVHRQTMMDVKEKIGSAGLISTYGCYRPASAAMILQDKVLRLLSGVIFIFATLLALKTQYTSVNERKRDIGILCSMGWSNRTVGMLIFFEAMISSALGALLGTIGVIFMTILWPGGGAERQVLSPLILIAVGLTLCSGLIAGVLPAWLAARKLPAQNLRMI